MEDVEVGKYQFNAVQKSRGVSVMKPSGYSANAYSSHESLPEHGDLRVMTREKNLSHGLRSRITGLQSVVPYGL